MLSIVAKNQNIETRVNLGAGVYSINEITPMGILLVCSDVELDEIRGCVCSEGGGFQVVPCLIDLLVRGDMVNLTSNLRIRSIRRTSQETHEVNFLFQDMQQDGYRLIAEHLAENGSSD